MRIALLTVYIFDETTKPLFDYHLAQIRRNTTVPYRIFATIKKLKPEFHDYVRAQPDIEVVEYDTPPGLNIREDHSFNLATLAAHAMAQDFTHAMTLHLDSFPIRKGWVEDFTATLDKEHAFASIVPHGYSAGLLWPRAHYETYAPEMLVPDTVRQSAEFARFQAEMPELDHIETGLGFIYQAWKLGLPWRRLETDAHEKIYAGQLFHFVAATHMTRTDLIKVRRTPLSAAAWAVVKPVLPVMSEGMREKIRTRFIDLDRETRDGTPRSKREELALLLRDPDAYVEKYARLYGAPLREAV